MKAFIILFLLMSVGVSGVNGNSASVTISGSIFEYHLMNTLFYSYSPHTGGFFLFQYELPLLPIADIIKSYLRVVFLSGSAR